MKLIEIIDIWSCFIQFVSYSLDVYCRTKHERRTNHDLVVRIAPQYLVLEAQMKRSEAQSWDWIIFTTGFGILSEGFFEMFDISGSKDGSLTSTSMQPLRWILSRTNTLMGMTVQLFWARRWVVKNCYFIEIIGIRTHVTDATTSRWSRWLNTEGERGNRFRHRIGRRLLSW